MHDRLEGLNVEALLLRVQAGARPGHLEQQLQAQGFTLGWYPALNPADTIGALLEDRSAGWRSSLYGDVPSCCVSVEAVLPDGTPVHTLTVPRSAAGPDWKHLLLGGHGHTGRLSTAVLRIFPRPEQVLARGYDFNDPQAAIQALSSLRHRGAIPAAAILLFRPTHSRLLLTFEGLSRLCEARVQIADRQAIARGAKPRLEGEVQAELESLERSLLFQGRSGAPGWLLGDARRRVSGSWRTLPDLVTTARAAGISELALLDARHANATLHLDATPLSPDQMLALRTQLERLGGVWLEQDRHASVLGTLINAAVPGFLPPVRGAHEHE